MTAKKTTKLIGNRAGWMSALVLLVLPVGALAQASARQAPPPGYEQIFSTVDRIMTTAVRNIGIRYSLNKEQLDFTNKLMKDRVHAFLRKHNAEVWPILRDVLKVQYQPGNTTKEEAMRISKAVGELMAEVQKAILDGNEAWSNILADDQKTIHEYDLREMGKTFAQMDERLAMWSKGEMLEGGIFPTPTQPVNQPPAPKRPSPGLPIPESTQLKADQFAAYVEQFITDYQLTNEQIESARSFMKEHQARAQKHERDNTAKEAELKKQREQAMQRGNSTARVEAEVALRKLGEPIEEEFDNMKQRLDGLPTAAQRARYSAKLEAAEKARTSVTKKQSATVKKKVKKATGG